MRLADEIAGHIVFAARAGLMDYAERCVLAGMAGPRWRAEDIEKAWMYARGIVHGRAMWPTAAEREVWEIVRAHQAPRSEPALRSPLRVEWAEPPR